jgi:hypothetical protein
MRKFLLLLLLSVEVSYGRGMTLVWKEASLNNNKLQLSSK